MNVLVLGAAGQLGDATSISWRDGGHQVSPWTRRDVDLADYSRLEKALVAARPELVINCAAFTNVDAAESDPQAALAVNGLAVRSMAAAASAIGATLVHYSTDFVFDGNADTPYVEEAPARPTSAYGASKLLGEWLAAGVARYYVLRVESLFGGEYARSSVDRIVEAVRGGREAPVFADRIVSPSYVQDVVWATAALVARDAAPGVYHCVNGGQASWLELGEAIVQHLGPAATGRLKAVRVADVPMKAKRPQFCALSNAKLRAAGVEMPDWRDALRRHLSGGAA